MKLLATRTLGGHPAPWLAVTFAVLFLGLLEDATEAGDAGDARLACARAKARNTFLADSIGLVASADVPPGVIQQAIDLWRSCVSYGEGFPAFVALPPDAPGEPHRRVTVRYRPGSGGGERCGRFVGVEIELFDFMTAPDGRQQPCGSLAQNMAHELGHVLGLQDAPPDPACHDHIMSLLTDRNGGHRKVHDEECQVAGQMWLTAWEHRQRQIVLERLPELAREETVLETSPSSDSPRQPPPNRENPP